MMVPIHEAIGDQLTCVFVDTGLMCLNVARQVVTLFRDHYNIPLIHVDAGQEFLAALVGVADPEAACIEGPTFLAQGADVTNKPPGTIEWE